MTQRNISRALDEINTLKAQIETQADLITKHRRKICELERRNTALQGIVGKVGITATTGPHSERKGQL